MTSKTLTFKLAFPPHQAQHWISCWEASKYPPLESDALQAGCQLAQGQCTSDLVDAVIKWKSARSRGYVGKNDLSLMREAFNVARELSFPKLAIGLLTSLHGFRVPVSSAFLTAMDPRRYTVIDWRALQALSCSLKSYEHADAYTPYRDECIRLVDVLGLKCLRDVDHALWGWSVGHEKAKDNGQL